MPLAGQQIHQRCVHPGPLVLGTNPLNSPTPTADRDRQICYRSLPKEAVGQVISAWLCMSPCSSDYIFTEASLSVFRRIVSEDSESLPMTSLHRTLLNRPPPFIDSASSRSRENPPDVRWRPSAIALTIAANFSNSSCFEDKSCDRSKNGITCFRRSSRLRTTYTNARSFLPLDLM